jgi:hypothetical protein
MRFRKSLLAALALGASAVMGGCGEDEEGNGNGSTVDLTREFVQIERLGNPLVSEVMFEKRNHGFHNSTAPSDDAANFTSTVQGFPSAFGRPAAVGNTLGAVLLPDMLIVDASKDGATAGWLSWALAQGYGGRRLTDDVVDAGLAAIFGTLLSPDGAIPALASDNVSANDRAFSNAFPYLAAPHQ